MIPKLPSRGEWLLHVLETFLRMVVGVTIVTTFPWLRPTGTGGLGPRHLGTEGSGWRRWSGRGVVRD